MLNFIKILVLTLSIAFSNQSALSQEYRISGKDALFVGLGGAAATSLGLLIINDTKLPNSSDFNLDQSRIGKFDSYALGKFDEDLRLTSDILLAANVITPLVALGLSNQNQTSSLLITYGVTTLATIGATTLTKGISRKYRPYAYGDIAPKDKLIDNDIMLSFFSGHSSISFASAASYFSLTSFDTKANPHRNYIGGILLLSASITAWLRVESGSHFPSDVIIGAAVGSLIGWYLPQFLKFEPNPENRIDVNVPIFNFNFAL